MVSNLKNMTDLTVNEIIEATGGELLAGDPGPFTGVSIDSRAIAEGGLFFALRGERFDGHAFIEKALVKGAGAVVDSRPSVLPQGRVIILVKDTLKALQDLAHFLRTRRDIPVVAVTGSNGKTTTKEMVYSVLSKRYRTLKNEGNLNNHIGLPLSLTRLSAEDEAAVLEMGMNAPGEIRRLREIAAPTHGVITNIGSAHLGMLGSREAIRDAKLEILPGLSVAIINADDEMLVRGVEKAEDFKGEIISFSINNDSNVMAKDIQSTERGSSFILKFRDIGEIPVSLGVHGIFNVYNALAAAAAAFSLGLPVDVIKAGLEDFSAFSMRFQIVKTKGLTVINDSYNANPSSMEESLKELVRLRTGRAVVVLGDMGELEEFSEEAHKSLGRLISEMGANVFVATGEMMSLAAEEIKKAGAGKGLEVYAFRDADDVSGNIMDILKEGDTVLIKGSRSMKMDRVAGRILNAV
ncbi:MAG: UDP-N-acetylmuramoyl-tripeptide--D-alanyl-D-alanine ligase [Nitrospiraceae bacterium]|nr:MAG: UDP-N-acetylmuramoyl-tripeptide--D-alanyl-D-alanine ligase [Nitrospiraceae bacterium]